MGENRKIRIARHHSHRRNASRLHIVADLP
jgi:hypothetical protein